MGDRDLFSLKGTEERIPKEVTEGPNPLQGAHGLLPGKEMIYGAIFQVTVTKPQVKERGMVSSDSRPRKAPTAPSITLL